MAKLADPAHGGSPDPSNCEVPDLLTLVGRGADGSADPLGRFTVVIKDFRGVPVVNSVVTLDFRDCPDIRICTDQGPAAQVFCESRRVAAVTDMNGTVTFHVLGGAANSGASPGPAGPAMYVYASGLYPGDLLLKAVRVAAIDQIGFDGLDPNDLSAWLADSFSGQTFARSDYNGDGWLDPNDLSLWLAASFAGGSAQGCGATCP